MLAHLGAGAMTSMISRRESGRFADASDAWTSKRRALDRCAERLDALLVYPVQHLSPPPALAAPPPPPAPAPPAPAPAPLVPANIWTRPTPVRAVVYAALFPQEAAQDDSYLDLRALDELSELGHDNLDRQIDQDADHPYLDYARTRVYGVIVGRSGRLANDGQQVRPFKCRGDSTNYCATFDVDDGFGYQTTVSLFVRAQDRRLLDQIRVGQVFLATGAVLARLMQDPTSARDETPWHIPARPAPATFSLLVMGHDERQSDLA
ncbi:hypothetical protein OIV83_004514 [Microbotryomycetes sp. JL201]|nr:hypothetical protein OIV83_004514 [Microbotryomycetes sp. JL201]